MGDVDVRNKLNVDWNIRLSLHYHGAYCVWAERSVNPPVKNSLEFSKHLSHPCVLYSVKPQR